MTAEKFGGTLLRSAHGLYLNVPGDGLETLQLLPLIETALPRGFAGTTLSRLVISPQKGEFSPEIFVTLSGKVQANHLPAILVWRDLVGALGDLSNQALPRVYAGLGTYTSARRCYEPGVHHPLKWDEPAIDYTLVNGMVIRSTSTRLFWRFEGAWMALKYSAETGKRLAKRGFLATVPCKDGSEILACSNAEGETIFGRVTQSNIYGTEFAFEPVEDSAKTLTGILRGYCSAKDGQLKAIYHVVGADRDDVRVIYKELPNPEAS